MHDDSYTHSHEHTHSHEPIHAHSHEHTHSVPEGNDRTKAVLTYMLDHNRHHAGELADLAPSLDGESRELLEEAVRFFENGNEKLAAALAALAGGNGGQDTE